MGGTNSSGRVEIFLDNKWGTICDPNWEERDAQIVCRQLEFTGHATALLATHSFGSGNETIWLNRIYCRGHEKNIIECAHLEGRMCDHTFDVAVICLQCEYCCKFRMVHYKVKLLKVVITVVM